MEVVRAFSRAWAAHDLEGVLALVTDDVLFDATGPAPDGARHVGRAAVAQVWGPILANPACRFDEEETFGAGERVVQRWRYSWGDGHVRGVDVFTVRDGRVAEKRSYVKG